MRLYFKQRMFSWFDSYDIYDESGRPVFTVEGKLSWGCIFWTGLGCILERFRSGC